MSSVFRMDLYLRSFSTVLLLLLLIEFACKTHVQAFFDNPAYGSDGGAKKTDTDAADTGIGYLVDLPNQGQGQGPQNQNYQNYQPNTNDAYLKSVNSGPPQGQGNYGSQGSYQQYPQYAPPAQPPPQDMSLPQTFYGSQYNLPGESNSDEDWKKKGKPNPHLISDTGTGYNQNQNANGYGGQGPGPSWNYQNLPNPNQGGQKPKVENTWDPSVNKWTEEESEAKRLDDLKLSGVSVENLLGTKSRLPDSYESNIIPKTNYRGPLYDPNGGYHNPGALSREEMERMRQRPVDYYKDKVIEHDPNNEFMGDPNPNANANNNPHKHHGHGHGYGYGGGDHGTNRHKKSHHTNHNNGDSKSKEVVEPDPPSTIQRIKNWFYASSGSSKQNKTNWLNVVLISVTAILQMYMSGVGVG